MHVTWFTWLHLTNGLYGTFTVFSFVVWSHSSGLFSDNAFGKLKSSNRSQGHISVPTSVSSRNRRYASLKLSHFVYSSHGNICLKINIISLKKEGTFFSKPKKWFHIWRSIPNVLFLWPNMSKSLPYHLSDSNENLIFESKIRPFNRLSSNKPIPDPKKRPDLLTTHPFV